MKTLLMLRHAKSSWKDADLDDHDRPLNKRGRATAPRIGKLIGELKLVPDLILSSTAIRARSTAEIVAENCGYKGKVEQRRGLYEASAGDIVRVIANVAHDEPRVLIVGHNPGFDELLYRLTGIHDHMPTAGLSQIDLPIATWQDLTTSTRGQLVKLWKPRDVFEDE